MVVDRGIMLSLHSPESLNTFTPHALEEFLLPEPRSKDNISGITIRYVAVLPGSSFWISYRVLVPPSPGLETKFYVFKLFIGSKHFTTWSVDGDAEKPEHRWKGRCMFGLFEDPIMIDYTAGGRKIFQKRSFAFAPPPPSARKTTFGQDPKKSSSREYGTGGMSSRKKLQKKCRSQELVHPVTPPGSSTKESPKVEEDGSFIDVKVFRAREKRRIPRNILQFDPEPYNTNCGRGLDLKLAGYATKSQARKYYEFDLIDPKDEPYTTFRFYYRSMEELKRIGISIGGDATPPVRTPSVDSQATVTPEKNVRTKLPIDSLQQRQQEAGHPLPVTEARSSTQECSMPPPRKSTRLLSHDDTHGSPPANPKRLSMPPSLRLLPSLGSWRRNASPVKTSTTSDETYAGSESDENTPKKSNQNLWRLFQDEREAEHGGY